MDLHNHSSAVTKKEKTMFSWKKNLIAIVLALKIASVAVGQTNPPPVQTPNVTTSSPTTQSIPTGLAKGVNPLGSYGGSNFDKVNLFNGNVSMSFPLASLTSRGGMSAGVVLSYNSKTWYVDKVETDVAARIAGEQPSIVTTYIPSYSEPDPEISSLGAGWTIHSGALRVVHTAIINKANRTCVFPGPGVQPPKPEKTITIVTFTSPDGTTYDFRDRIYDGEPRFLVNCEPISRGKRFESKDGTSATFVSDTEIKDSLFSTNETNISGYVYLRDGTRFRIEQGRVVKQRDHNGNLIKYLYDGNRLKTVIDNMGRTIEVRYDVSTGVLATITVKGIGGQDRVTTVRGRKLENHLATGQTKKNIDQLFPAEAVQLSIPDIPFNPRVVNEVILPDSSTPIALDGHKWEFKYNSYGEVVSVKTPAKGVVEFEMGPNIGLNNGGYDPTLNQIFRRVVERRTFPSNSTQIEGKVTYSDPTDPSRIVNGDVTVEQTEVDPNNGDRILSKSSHKFSGHPKRGLDRAGGTPPQTGYRPWLEGKELETQQFNFDGVTPMRRSITTYQQQSGVAWIAGADANTLAQPENNPRITRSTNSLLDGGTKTSKVDYEYDQFNNVTSEVLTGYANEIIRRVERSYVTSLNGIDYTALNAQESDDLDTVLDTHLRSLVDTETIKNGAGIVENTTKYEYDQYSGANNAALTPRTLTVDSHAQLYQSPSRVQRGNVTAVTTGFGRPEASTLYSHYDVLGNVVEVLGPNPGQRSESVYNLSSQFTFPEQSKQHVSSGLSGSRVLTSSRVFDFHTGAVLSSTGLNNDTTTFQYNDKLDRLTLETRPGGDSNGGFGRTTYTYSAPGVYPNTVTVESSLDSGRVLTSVSEFDGFLRTTKQRRTDPEGDVLSETFYDALGRVEKVTNPFRPLSGLSSTDGYTTSQYDALSRVFRIQTFGNSDFLTGTVNTTYQTNFVTVTDQAGKQRKSETDAAGRLTNVYEPNSTSQTLDQITSYSYDARSNLVQVNQGVQTRTFTYDALSRLISATSPESGDASSNGSTFYKYDKASNLIERKDPRNIITTYSYDSINRLATKTYSDSTPEARYFYDVVPSGLPSGVSLPPGFSFQNLLGRTSAILSPSTTRDAATALFHTYDIGGRITKSSQLLDGQHYVTNSSYNLASLPVEHTYPSTRTISHSYNIAGQITQVMSNDQTISQNAEYSPSGALANQILGNGLNHSIKYNSRLQPTDISLGFFRFSDEKFRLSYDYGLYPFSSLSSATTPEPQLDQSKNNGNIGRITIYTGQDDGGGGSQLTSGRFIPGNGAKNTFNLTSTGVFEQAFAYDELNRLKLAKEFGDLGCPSVGGGSADSVVAQVEPQKQTTITLEGVALNQLQSLSVGGSGLSVSILSSSANSLTLMVDASSGSTGLHELRFTSACGEVVAGLIQVLCAATDSLGQTGDFFAVDGVGSFNATNSPLGLENVSKAHSEGTAMFEVDLTNASLARPDSQLQLIISYSAQVISPQLNPGSSTVVNMGVLINGQGAIAQAPFNSVSDSLGVFIDSNGNASGGDSAERNRRDRTYFVLLPPNSVGTKVRVECIFSYDSTSLGNGNLPTVFVNLNGRTTCADLNGFSTSIEPSPLALNPGVTWNQSYDYDRYGNRLSVSGTNAQTLQISPSKNRISSPGYDYDLAGNLIADPSGKSFLYDAENRLISVSQGSNTISNYFYDSNGWRVKKLTPSLTTRFVYDQSGRLLAEYDGQVVAAIGSPAREHIYGASGMLATVESDKINYHTPDHLGSPRILTDSSSQVISRRDFLPFGDQLSDSVGNRSSIPGYSITDSIRQKFTGYQRDEETGLDFAQARYYSNINGRFMSVDPFRGSTKVGNPQTLNLYSYTLNNPINFTDPLGLEPEKKEGFFSKVGKAFKAFGKGVANKVSSTVVKILRLSKEPEKVLKEDVQVYIDLAGDYQEYANNPTDVNDAIKESIEQGNLPTAVAEAAGEVVPDLLLGKIIPIPPFIFREGRTNPGSLTPRDVDGGILSFRDSLSNPYPLPQGQLPVFKFGNEYFKVDTSKLPVGSVIPDNVPPGHVGIKGAMATPEQIKAAVVDKGKLPKKD
jgi:RHS repeat-associated protein